MKNKIVVGIYTLHAALILLQFLNGGDDLLKVSALDLVELNAVAHKVEGGQRIDAIDGPAVRLSGIDINRAKQDILVLSGQSVELGLNGLSRSAPRSSVLDNNLKVQVKNISSGNSTQMN